MFLSHRPLAEKTLRDSRNHGGIGKMWEWLRSGREDSNNRLRMAHLGSASQPLCRGMETVGLASNEKEKRTGTQKCLMLCPGLEAQDDIELRTQGFGARLCAPAPTLQLTTYPTVQEASPKAHPMDYAEPK